ncbi:unnamed protein product [Mytilus edulis]|uniref:Uncharacterized protein n=1 Tax=Mytilus edulis TaxID=6550 RepID=A0A8S3RCA4_MYTED|nr:unnamed protein product [Mytilus edulis]
MAPQEKINYFKLVALIADIACLVIWKYIREKILGKDSFETFLNKENHTLVHLYETLPCCECIVKSSDTGYRKEHKALHMKDPKVFSKSMEKDCHKTMEEIQSTRFLQLDLPASWSRTKVLEYLDEMRINETSDMNLRIIAVSPDDLNLYSEIARTVLSEVELLKDEVQKLLSGMLLEAAIDTKESAEVGFNVTIPTITEETSEINSDDEHDCKTRTEFNVINEKDVAVSYNRDIEVIDTNTEQVKKTIVTRGVISGISFQNGLMYVVIGHQKIDVMKMTEEIVRSFHCPFQSLHIGLSTGSFAMLR